MVGGAHVPRDALVTGDRVGFPALAVAHSRKVQKGEDFDLAEVAATWRPTREGGSREDAEDEIEFGAFGLFDGHGGRACAAHCAERFLPELVAALDAEGALGRGERADDAFERRLPNALRAAFAAVDAAFLSKDVHSGATATICVVRGRCVTTAAVGDSLATLDLGPGTPVLRLSVEHRLDTSESERKRIEEAGGEVRPTEYEDGPNGERVGVGPLRVWPGGLAVSRSIGDRDGKKGGVISEPDVSMVIVPDRFPGARLLLASDGLWDAATPKQASAHASKMNTQNAAAALNKLAQMMKDNRDDITVLVVDMILEESKKAGPFAVKPERGSEKPVLYHPFSKKAHDPLPLPSERHAERKRIKDEEAAKQAALECARRAEEEEAMKALEERKEAERRAEAEAEDQGWEEANTKGTKKKENESKQHRVKDKKDKKPRQPKQHKQPKPKVAVDDQAPEQGSSEPVAIVQNKERKQEKKQKKKKGDLDIPDVSALQLETHAVGAKNGGKKAKKAKNKERLRPPTPPNHIRPHIQPPLPPGPPNIMNAQSIPVLHPYQGPMHHPIPTAQPPLPGMLPQGLPPPGLPPVAPPHMFAHGMPPPMHPSFNPQGYSQQPNNRAEHLMRLMRSGSPPVPSGLPPGVVSDRQSPPERPNVEAPNTPVKEQEKGQRKAQSNKKGNRRPRKWNQSTRKNAGKAKPAE